MSRWFHFALSRIVETTDLPPLLASEMDSITNSGKGKHQREYELWVVIQVIVWILFFWIWLRPCADTWTKRMSCERFQTIVHLFCSLLHIWWQKWPWCSKFWNHPHSLFIVVIWQFCDWLNNTLCHACWIVILSSLWALHFQEQLPPLIHFTHPLLQVFELVDVWWCSGVLLSQTL